MKIRTRIGQIIFFLLIISMGVQFAFGQSAPLDGFDDYVNKAIKDWEVPGLSIAIVKDDKIVLAKGYGVRKLGDPAPVDEKTLFAIGSSSKAFTAAALAILVDEGKVKWDDPVIKHLPGFQTFDPYVTREMTVRDLLTHRSGLERGDFLWYGTDNDREEIMRRARFLKPTWSLRSTFGYQNLMYLAAGQLIGKVSGKSWDEFITQRIFTPLGMTASNTTIRDFKTDGNVAAPHAEFESKVEAIAWRNIDNIAPAGSINSNVTDMAQWVRAQLGQGNYQATRLFSSGAATEMHMPQTVMRIEGASKLLYPEAHFMTYGLGWFLSDYKGRKLVEHGGAIDGMRAQVAMLPDEKLGVVILSNMNGTIISMPLMYRIFDAYLGAPQKDWSTEMLKSIKILIEQGRAAEKKAESERVAGTKPSLTVEKYAGTYKNDLYGEVKVVNSGDKLNFRFGPAFVSDLEHWHYDTYRARFRGAGETKASMTFALNSKGEVDTVTLNLPGLAEYPFKRVAEPPKATAAVAVSEAELRRFAGKYALANPPLEIGVEMIGGELKLIVPGQPVYTLVPTGGGKFAIKDAPAGFGVSFETDGNKVKSLTITQGTVTFTLLPKS